MTDTPIIFSAPMIRALLDGRKTMTRRLATLRNCQFGSLNGKVAKSYWEDHAAWDRAWTDHGFPDEFGIHSYQYLHVPCHDSDDPAQPSVSCDHCLEWGLAGTSHRLYPNIKPGDRLWVRETWAKTHVSHAAAEWIVYSACDNRTNYGGPWKSPIHCARADSRITLIVTATKIVRLYDISDDDIRAEGVTEPDGSWLSAWRNLWENIHGPEHWDSNPFVVAITFTAHKQNIDSLPKAETA